MKILILALFGLSSFAFTVPRVYNSGKLVEVTKDHYLIRTKSKKYIKVKPFLNNPKIGIDVSYPLSTKTVEVDKNFLFNQATKLVTQQEYTSDIIEAYLKTLAEVSRNGLYKVESTNGSLFSFNVLEMLIPSACAEGKECDNMCYFGGWPSTRKGSYCQAPWKVKTDSRVKEIDSEVYSNDFSCGGKNRFRCNPKIFGPYDSSLDPVQFVDTRNSKAHGRVGICIKADPSYAFATAQCLEASSKVPNFKEALKERYNDNKETFDKLIDNINCFCDAQATDKREFSCNALRSRLATIFEEAPVITPTEIEPVVVVPKKIPIEDGGGKDKKIPIEDGGREEIVASIPEIVLSEEVIEQQEEPLPKELVYYSCDFIGGESLFEGKDANCKNTNVCLKKLSCAAYSKEEKKYDVHSKLLAYCPCNVNDATKCANMKADNAIKVNSSSDDSSTQVNEQ